MRMGLHVGQSAADVAAYHKGDWDGAVGQQCGDVLSDDERAAATGVASLACSIVTGMRVFGSVADDTDGRGGRLL